MEKNDVSSFQNFSLYGKILDFNNYINRFVINCIPEVHRNLRIHFLDEAFMLTKNMFYATYNKGNIRMKYLIELQVNISLIDMMLLQMKEFRNIKKAKLDTSISKLSDIKNIIYGWKFNEESKVK